VRDRPPTTHRSAFGVVGLTVAVALGALVGPGATGTAAADTTTPLAAHTLDRAVQCLADRSPDELVRGYQTDRYTSDIPDDGAVDALGALWLQTDNWPVSFEGGAGGCWLGGEIIGTYPQSTAWSTFHHTGGLNFTNRDFTIDGLRVHNIGDGIRARAGASDFDITGVHLSFIHDDCLENDRLYTGTIADSLFDGCYVGFSARPSSSDTTSDGRTHTMTVDHSLLRLQPMPTTYKGTAPGHGGFFKWDDTGRSPALSLHDNVFRVDQLPNHGSLGLPDGYAVACSGNTIVWLGAGAFPEAASWRAKCPDTRIVTDRAVWDAAVAAWRAAH
jgi:hypothetical protein